MNIFEIDNEIKKLDAENVLGREDGMDDGPQIHQDNHYSHGYYEHCMYYKQGKDLFVDVYVEDGKIKVEVEKGIGQKFDRLLRNNNATIEDILIEIKHLINY